MTDRPKPPTFIKAEVKNAIVNDSLGTTDPADTTGPDEPKATGDAKAKLKDKNRED